MRGSDSEGFQLRSLSCSRGFRLAVAHITVGYRDWLVSSLVLCLAWREVV